MGTPDGYGREEGCYGGGEPFRAGGVEEGHKEGQKLGGRYAVQGNVSQLTDWCFQTIDRKISQ